MTMMIIMIIITFCALDILILEFFTCKWQLVWNMLIKFIIVILAKMSSWALPFPLPSECAEIHIVDVPTFITIQTRDPHKVTQGLV